MVLDPDKLQILIEQLSQLCGQDPHTSTALADACILPITDEEDLLERAELLDQIVATGEHHMLTLFSNGILQRIEEFEQQQSANEPHLLLKQLMTERDLKQKDLSHIVPQSVLSEILNQKRQMNLRHVKKFADFFDIPVDSFIKR